MSIPTLREHPPSRALRCRMIAERHTVQIPRPREPGDSESRVRGRALFVRATMVQRSLYVSKRSYQLLAWVVGVHCYGFYSATANCCCQRSVAACPVHGRYSTLGG